MSTPRWAEAHRLAVAAGRPTYTDPTTGWIVMTELHHRQRGDCCGNGCRHCPFDHEAVEPERRRALQRPVLADTLPPC